MRNFFLMDSYSRLNSMVNNEYSLICNSGNRKICNSGNRTKPNAIAEIGNLNVFNKAGEALSLCQFTAFRC